MWPASQIKLSLGKWPSEVLFLQLLANVLFAGMYGYWQQMKTTEDLEGLEFYNLQRHSYDEIHMSLVRFYVKVSKMGKGSDPPP